MRRTGKITEFLKSLKSMQTDECINWPFSKDKDGYGRCRREKTRAAHRVSYKQNVGEIKKGMVVMHKCDNPSCVNPRHLSQGTHADNNADMYSKGRNKVSHKESFCDNRGEKHGLSKLSNEKVKEIRDLYSAGNSTQKALSEMFGVSRSAIYDVINRKTWNYLAYPATIGE